MHHLKLIDLLRVFYSTRSSFLPVVALNGDGNPSDLLEGFLSREKINREMTDLERASRELHAIPPELLIREHFPGDLHSYLETTPEIPVVDMKGREIGFWDREKVLSAWTILKKKYEEQAREKPADPVPASPEPTPSHSEGEWLARLILSGIPNPLFASDLDGNTLFYNEAFEERILEDPHFKQSIRLVESYFLEVNRNLLARSLSDGPESHGPGGIRTVWLEEVGLFLRVNDLGNGGRLYGYLYMFQDPGINGAWETAEALLAAGYDLTGLLEEMETHIIVQGLSRHGQNISHTAESLGLRRSTLQNRMKKLKIDERFERPAGPIRRTRKVEGEKREPEPLPEPPAPAAKKSRKSSTGNGSRSSTKKTGTSGPKGGSGSKSSAKKKGASPRKKGRPGT